MGGRRPSAAVVAIGAYLVLSELDRLLGACLGRTGVPATAAALLGPLGFVNTGAWDVWASSAYAPVAVRVLLLYLLVDVGFYLAYWRLLRRWLAVAEGLGARPARRALAVLVGAQVAGTAVALVDVAALRVGGTAGVPTGLRLLLTGVVGVKWLAAGVLAGCGARVVAHHRADVALAARRWIRALYCQRLSLLVVGVLAALALSPGPDVADQVPDVLRRWTDPQAPPMHLVAGLVATAVTALGLFVLGRLRSERAWREHVDGQDRPDARPSLLWLLWPAAITVTGTAIVATGARPSLDWRFGLAVAVPAAIFAVSWVMHCRDRRPEAPPPPPWARPHRDGPQARTVWRAGDRLAGAVVVLLGLALLRAFTAPVVLGPPGATGWQAWTRQAADLVALVAGAALVLLAPPWLEAGREALDLRLGRGATDARAARGRPDSAPGTVYRWGALWPPEPSTRRVTGWAWAAWLAAVGTLAVLALWPLRTSAFLGVLATAELLLLGWATVVGIVLVHLQHRRPAEVFRLVGLRSNPVMTLVVAVLLVSSLGGGDSDVHAVRGAASAGPAAQVRLADLARGWLADGAGCGFTLTADRAPGLAGAGLREVTVRPLLLVAADGGGIRASRWTVEALDQVRRAWRQGAPGCDRSPVLLASGVSGGSVGLALARAGEGAAAAQRRIEEPDALGAATVGLLLRDVLAGGTGLMLPALDGPGAVRPGDDGRRGGWTGGWTDRAGLMETVWERDVPALREPFGPAGADRQGALVLNSVAAGSGCRVLVSQVDLRSGGAAGAPPSRGFPGPDCRAVTDLPAASLDLVQSYPCLPRLTWAGAAMLSARFPYVTPAGRVTRCGPDLTDLQLVDGGYGEGSGVGTLQEASRGVLDAVRAANAQAGTTRGAARTVVVPFVVFLQNRPGADVSAPPPDLSAELLVPLAGRAAAGVQGATGSWLQRASATLQGACPDGDAGCRATLAAVWRSVPDGVVVVAPTSQPAVEPPLGWTLSTASRERLVRAMDREAATCRDPGTTGVLGGYGRLGALLGWLRDHRECATGGAGGPGAPAEAAARRAP